MITSLIVSMGIFVQSPHCTDNRTAVLNIKAMAVNVYKTHKILIKLATVFKRPFIFILTAAAESLTGTFYLGPDRNK